MKGKEEQNIKRVEQEQGEKAYLLTKAFLAYPTALGESIHSKKLELCMRSKLEGTQMCTTGSENLGNYAQEQSSVC